MKSPGTSVFYLRETRFLRKTEDNFALKTATSHRGIKKLLLDLYWTDAHQQSVLKLRSMRQHHQTAHARTHTYHCNGGLVRVSSYPKRGEAT